MIRRVWMMIAAVVLSAIFAVSPGFLNASDHDDGETDTKSRNTNLTDLYLFREIDQNSVAAQGDLILVMNTNPRSVARQQYYFSTSARYEFKIERAANVNAAPTAEGLGSPDVILRFEFGAPSASSQEITFTAIRDGVTLFGPTSVGLTTPLDASPVPNSVVVAGSTLMIFAGLREDPFFFDVEQFFRVRAGALGLGPAERFRNPGLDFAAGYNVNAIVVRVPVVFLQGLSPATTFDVWETISLPSGSDWLQVERLAQPAINEGLLRTNAFLNTLNAVTPAFEALALTPGTAEAVAAAPILAEAVGTLTALGNSPSEIAAIVGAFLPDVMRIDTTQPSGYASAVNSAGRPIRGRKIRDDVIDITLRVIVSGANVLLERDNVSYDGPNRGVTRHKPVLPGFPYLAAPN